MTHFERFERFLATLEKSAECWLSGRTRQRVLRFQYFDGGSHRCALDAAHQDPSETDTSLEEVSVSHNLLWSLVGKRHVIDVKSFYGDLHQGLL